MMLLRALRALLLALLVALALAPASLAAAAANDSSGDSPECSVQRRIDRALSRPSSERKPLLLFWDDEGTNYSLFEMWFGSGSHMRCPVSCRVAHSRDPRMQREAEVVVFWATPLNKGLNPSREKCPGQRWVQVSTEAADIGILDRTPPGGLMADGSPSPIDHEVSWRRGLGREKVTWMNNYDWNQDFARPPGDSILREAEVLTPLKTRSGREPGQAAVAAFISNCGAMSPRLSLLRELQQYIPVDSFGACEHNKDVPAHWVEEGDTSRGLLTQKARILQRRYKFLLAFENQETDDYVTEKFYAPLAIGVLPVVLGAPNIDEYAPQGEGQHPAWLNVRDFDTVKQLAERIDYLDRNDEEYLKYFQWRKHGVQGKLLREAIAGSWLYTPCQLCQSMHRQLYGTQPRSILPEDWHRFADPVEREKERRESAERKKRREEKKKKQRSREQQQQQQASSETVAAAVDTGKHEDL